MVKFLSSGVCKITHDKYLIEIESNLQTNIYRKQLLGEPLKLIDTFDDIDNKIDCLFKAFYLINEHNKRSNHTM